jgi:hypothetical protein
MSVNASQAIYGSLPGKRSIYRMWVATSGSES